MAKAGSTRINFKTNKNVTGSNCTNNTLNNDGTPDSNTETKDSSNNKNGGNKKKKDNVNKTAEEAFSDHVVGEDGDENRKEDADDGVSETSDIDVAASGGESKRLEKAKSEEGKESAPTAKLLTKAPSSEERKGSAEGSAKQSKS